MTQAGGPALGASLGSLSYGAELELGHLQGPPPWYSDLWVGSILVLVVLLVLIMATYTDTLLGAECGVLAAVPLAEASGPN